MASVNEAEINVIGAGGRGHGALKLGQILKNPNLWWIMLMYHCFCYGSFWFLVWTASYLAEEKGMDTGLLAGFTALPFILGAFANFAGGFSSDALVKRMGLKWGRRVIGAGGVGLAGILMLVSLLIENPYMAAFVLALAFAASDFMLPNCWAVCLDIGQDNAGSVTGAMNTAGQAGSAVVSAYYGILVEQYGWNYPLVLIACMSLISALLWFKIDPTQKLSGGSAPTGIGVEELA
jgi:predicted MFS family arabinose efflux permease